MDTWFVILASLSFLALEVIAGIVRKAYEEAKFFQDLEARKEKSEQ